MTRRAAFLGAEARVPCSGSLAKRVDGSRVAPRTLGLDRANVVSSWVSRSLGLTAYHDPPQCHVGGDAPAIGPGTTGLRRPSSPPGSISRALFPDANCTDTPRGDGRIMRPIRIDTASDWPHLHMDWRDEITQLRRDTRRTYRLWRHYPLLMTGIWLCAFGRIWVWHDNNSHFRTVVFIVLSGFVFAITTGLAAAGWSLPAIALAPVYGGWLLTLGYMFGHEIKHVQVASLEIDFARGEIRPRESGDDD